MAEWLCSLCAGVPFDTPHPLSVPFPELSHDATASACSIPPPPSATEYIALEQHSPRVAQRIMELLLDSMATSGSLSSMLTRLDASLPGAPLPNFPSPPKLYPLGLAVEAMVMSGLPRTESIKIGRITPGGTITEFPVPTSKSQPFGIGSGPDGNLWFTEYSGNKIGRITTS